MAEIHRPSRIRCHPFLSSQARIRFLADVEQRHQPIRQRHQNLPWSVIVFDESGAYRVDFPDNRPQCRLEQHRVNRPIYLYIFAELVDLVHPVQPLLSEPYLALRCRQRQDSTISTRYCHLPRPPLIVSAEGTAVRNVPGERAFAHHIDPVGMTDRSRVRTNGAVTTPANCGFTTGENALQIPSMGAHRVLTHMRNAECVQAVNLVDSSLVRPLPTIKGQEI